MSPVVMSSASARRQDAGPIANRATMPVTIFDCVVDMPDGEQHHNQREIDPQRDRTHIFTPDLKLLHFKSEIAPWTCNSSFSRYPGLASPVYRSAIGMEVDDSFVPRCVGEQTHWDSARFKPIEGPGHPRDTRSRSSRHGELASGGSLRCNPRGDHSGLNPA